MRRLILALFALLPASSVADGLDDSDQIRLAEARELSRVTGESIWPGWNAAPWAVLLVHEDQEYLVWHPDPSGDFASQGQNEDLATDVWSRPRQFDTSLLATFPAVNGIVTIVIGPPQTTGRRSTPWLTTLLHEHFHQMQMSQPDYYARVAALDLAGDDESGMWMLNYAFPYEQPEVGAYFSEIARILADALENSSDASDAGDQVKALFAQIQSSLSTADYRYVMFQLWQEGIARYVQYRALSIMADGKMSQEFTDLHDYDPPSQVRAEQEAALIEELRGLNLAQQQRTAFYPIGAAWGLLLDKLEPDWRKEYFAQPFMLPALPSRR